MSNVKNSVDTTPVRIGALFAGALLLLLRLAWEFVDPVLPGSFKGCIYARDMTLLLPAGCLLGYAFFKMPARRKFAPIGRMEVTALQWRIAAISLPFIAFLACTFISIAVLRTRAHIADEANYLFQAKVFAREAMSTQPPLLPPEFFRLHYLVQSPDTWYSSFFPGQSLLLAAGQRVGMPYVVNPLLCALLVLSILLISRRLFSPQAGILAGVLALCSPFVLFQGASYFSHMATAILVSLGLTWMLTCNTRPFAKAFGCGAAIGAALLFRPLSAVILCAFWIILLAHDQIHGEKSSFGRWFRQLLLSGLGALPFGTAFLVYNYLLTGDPFLTPHQVAMPDERIVFGLHSLKNLGINLIGLSVDLLGVPILSLLPAALFFLSGARYARPIAVFIMLYWVAYSAYPYHGLSYGPRFFFETAPILLAGSAHVIASWIAEPDGTSAPFRRHAATAFLAAVILISILCTIPARSMVFHRRARLYDIRDLVQQEVRPPAVVMIVNPDEERIYPYMAGFQLNSPTFDGDVIFVRNRANSEHLIRATYPERTLYLLDVNRHEVIPVKSTKPPAIHQQ